MNFLAILCLFGVALCWLLPGWHHMPAERAAEWRLLCVPLSSAALLSGLTTHGDAILLPWTAALATIIALDLALRSLRRPHAPRWVASAMTVLAVALLLPVG